MSFTGSQEFSSITSIAVAGLTGSYTGNTLSVGIGGNIQVKKGAGRFGGITVGETAAGPIKIIDGTSGTVENLGYLKASIVENFYKYGCSFAQGLRVILSSTSRITVVYR